MKKSGAYIIGISDCRQEVCAASGRISTQSGTALEIFEKSHDEEKNTRLIDKVTRSGHTSTVEHVFFNLAFENVSVVVEQFMIEFRLASFTVKSRRYVDFSDCGYFVPEFDDEETAVLYKENMDKFFEAYSFLCENGIPKEDARFVLPYCFYSNFYCSLNGREMLNVLKAMLFGRGSKIAEIRKIGERLLEDCRRLAPGLFIDFEEKGKSYSDELDLGFSFKKGNSGKLCDILTYTLDGEKNVAIAALVENYNCSLEDAQKTVESKENLEKILSALCKSSRPRALEGFNCTVRFNGVSLACLTHFARHRMQSICIPNLLKASRESYIIPETVKADETLLDVYLSCFMRMKEFYSTMKEKGASDSELVYCVLSGNTLDFVSTLNARELQLFFRLRSCTRAQWEIQAYCNELLPELRRLAPSLFINYGPSCYVNGKCPEGKFCCGRAAEMQEKYAKM